MKNLIPPFVLLLLFLSSCKKADPILVPQVEVNTGYFQNTIGSYWVYEWFEIDSNGVETQLGIIDTIQNISQVVINNMNYVERTTSVLGNESQNIFLRDSLGYIVDSKGEIKYSYTDFTDTLSTGAISTLDVIWHKKMFDNVSINVPAGSFTTIESKQYIYDTTTFPFTKCGEPAIECAIIVAPGVGTVKKETGYFSSLVFCVNRYEGRLIDYHIQ